MKYLFTLLLLLIATNIFAQKTDKIYLKDGIIIRGEVGEVKWRYVVISNDEWRRPKRIPVADIHHIRYADGISDTFSRQPIVFARQAAPLKGRNFVLAAPISGVILNGNGYAAAGIYYERIIDKDLNFGITFPVNICVTELGANARNASFLATPGLLFHSNVNKRADFAFGPSLLLTNANGYNGPYKLSVGSLLNARLNVRRTASVFCVHSNFGVSFHEASRQSLFFQLGIAAGGNF